jgi:hypothetical protein
MFSMSNFAIWVCLQNRVQYSLRTFKVHYVSITFPVSIAITWGVLVHWWSWMARRIRRIHQIACDDLF